MRLEEGCTGVEGDGQYLWSIVEKSPLEEYM